MAEEAFTEDEQDALEEEEKGPQGEEQPPPRYKECKLKCKQRIDELATPNKRIFLALWNQHAYHFPREKIEYLKQLLQELYAMSPEETVKYFAELREEARAASSRRKMKQKLRRLLLKKYKERQRMRAYCLFKKLLKCGLTYAVDNPVPPMISLRLRYLSDIILEQLCNLHGADMPNRAKPDKCGQLLISIADWIAIAIERLYYASQITISKTVDEELFWGQQNQPPPPPQEPPTLIGAPLAQSTPRNSLQLQEPLMQSTPKNSLELSERPQAPVNSTFVDLGQPRTASTPKKRPPVYSFRAEDAPPPHFFDRTELELPFHRHRPSLGSYEKKHLSKAEKAIYEFTSKQVVAGKIPKCGAKLKKRNKSKKSQNSSCGCYSQNSTAIV